MQAVRQILKVQDRVVTIQLPADFVAEEVEVIVLPAPVKTNGQVANEDNTPSAIQWILSMDTTRLTPDQLQAHHRTSALLRQWLANRSKPIFGAFTGLVKVADDFDEPLPDETIELFYADNLVR
jgi:TPP-dependent 2-oxoacid decarboxylase